MAKNDYLVQYWFDAIKLGDVVVEHNVVLARTGSKRRF